MGCAGLLEAVHDSVGRGIGDLSADDKAFLHKETGVDRCCGVRIVEDLVDIASDFLPGIGGQVKALTDLQIIIAGKDLIVCSIGDGNGLCFLGLCIDAPTVGC